MLKQDEREIAMMYARTCNITCRHCGIESSPRNKSRMALADAKQYVLEAASIPEIRKFTFTGGEPFLFQDEHAELIKLASDLGLSTRVVTNGFWAKNKASGLQMLARMKAAGLRELNFSADKFHLEEMEAQTLRNALECAKELGYARIISFVTNDDRPVLDNLAEMYGLPRAELRDLRELLGELGCTEDLDPIKDDAIFVFAGGLIGLGRAAEHPDELRHFPVSMFPRGVPCGEVVNKPVIYPDGDFQACCCAGGKMGVFTVGNLHDEPLSELYPRMLARSQFRMINTYGPLELYKAIARARADLPRQGRYTSICELCVRSTEGLTIAEVDAIVDAALAARTLAVLGVVALPDAVPDALLDAAPVPTRRSLALRVLA